MNAAGPWSDEFPKVSGAHLVQYVGDWFPKGDRNNVKIELVHIVHDEKGGPLRALSDGSFLEPDQMKGWKWAKVYAAT